VVCHNCRTECRKFGKRGDRQRHQCTQCQKVFTDARDNTLDGMYLPVENATRVLELLTEGMSLSAVERLTGVHHTTILKLLVQIGERCEKFTADRISNVRVKNVEVDEIWQFIRKKERHKWSHEIEDHSIGDSYTFVAIERDTKLVLAWHLGRRTAISTMQFVGKLRKAVNPMHWFQLTSDGFRPYIEAVDYQFAGRIDFAQLVKVYATAREGEERYSPGDVVETIPTPILGNPDPARICTSHVERQNLTMRMHMRRLTRLTSGFSKKWENHRAALAIHFAWYNFVRVHRTLRTTPAMASGLTDHIWTLRELLEAA
jgi:transposase-like protein/IS1 family transposase